MRKKHAQSGLIVGTREGSGEEVVLSGAQMMASRFIFGTTGSGKSRFIASLIVQLINLGIGCLLLDPHSDLCEDILAFLWETGFYSRTEAFSRVRYLRFAGQDNKYPAFNVLRQAGQSSHEIARWVWSAMCRAWPELAGAAPLMEQVMLSGVFVLAENGLSLTKLNRLLTDAAFRHQLLQRVSDPQVLEFFARYDASGKRTSMLSESALRRAFLLSFTPALRNTLGARENLLNMRSLMDNAHGVTVLCDLGDLDEETQRMLGCCLTIQAETAALSRADIPEEERRPYALFLDEWSMFADQSEVALERMLTLVRKYGLSVSLAAQTLGQTRKLQSALQNCLPIILRCGGLDSEWAAARVGSYDPTRTKTTASGHPQFMSRGEQQAELADRLERLPARHALIRLGDETIPFYTLGLPAARCSRAEMAALKAEYAKRWLRSPEEEMDIPAASEEELVPEVPGDPSLVARRSRVVRRVVPLDPTKDLLNDGDI